jgi:hypothetical protein
MRCSIIRKVFAIFIFACASVNTAQSAELISLRATYASIGGEAQL